MSFKDMLGLGPPKAVVGRSNRLGRAIFASLPKPHIWLCALYVLRI
jgi:hypothetical protein